MPRTRRLKGGFGFFSRAPSRTPLLQRMSRRIRGVFKRPTSTNRNSRTFGSVSRRDSSNSRSMPAKRSFTHKISRFFGYNKTPLKKTSPGIELTTLPDKRVAQPKIRQPLEPPNIDWIELTMDMIRSMTREEKIQKLKELFDYPDRYLYLIGGYFPKRYESHFRYFKDPNLIQCLTDNQVGYVLIDIMLQYDRKYNFPEYNKVLAEVKTFDPVIYVKYDRSVGQWFHSYNTVGFSNYVDKYAGVQPINEVSGKDMETIISSLAKYIGDDKVTKDTIIPLDVKTCDALNPFVAELPSEYNDAFTLHL